MTTKTGRNFQPSAMYTHDNIGVLRGMNSETVDLIYLDPPFNTNRHFVSPFGKDRGEFSDAFGKARIKEEWLYSIQTEHPKLFTLLNAIRDIDGRDSVNFCYLAFMAIRLIECRRVLKDTGSIYLHIDPTMSHYLKVVMDYIFGQENYRNEIVWAYSGPANIKKWFPKKHDIILFYAKTRAAKFNPQHIKHKSGIHNTGTVFGKKDGDNEKIRKREKVGKLIEDWWADIGSGAHISKKERTGYPTQKPLALLKRIINASSKVGDMVLDPFCGCATAPVAAKLLNRRWIGIDIHEQAYAEVTRRLKEHEDELQQDLAEGEIDDTPVTNPTKPPRRTDGGAPAPSGMEFVYIMSNPAWKNKLKVGRAKDAYDRVNYFQTGDPERAYSLEYKIATPNAAATEKHMHKTFGADHEWIAGVSLETLIKAIESYDPGA